MKLLATLSLVLFVMSCSSAKKEKTPRDWDSGANKTRSYGDEKAMEQDETYRNQFPRPRPSTNQSPF